MLRKAVTIDENDDDAEDEGETEDEEDGSGPYPDVPATAFIDWNPESGALRPWPCTSSLEMLAIRRIDISQADDRFYLDTQERSCARLGMFESLRILQLVRSQFANGRWRNFERVRLSVGNGLEKLAGLKKLEELHIPHMCHVFEIQDVQWMVGHWPRL